MKSTPASMGAAFSTAARSRRCGKAFVFFAVLLPAIFGVLGLVIDGGMLRVKHRLAQNAADAASTAAAAALASGQTASVATSVAVEYVTTGNGLSSASVTVLIPPADGPYAGQSGYVEVQVALAVPTFMMQVVGAAGTNTVHATSVAGTKPATAGAAIVVLDPNPPGISLGSLAGLTLPTTPSPNLGGLEILGVGQLRVNGAVLVDTTWGGQDQNGDPAGTESGFRSAVTCMPLVALTSMAALDLRVTGGVDNPNNYSNFTPGQPSPLEANRKPVPDPLAGLPVPTTAVDPINVVATLRGGVTVVGLPLGGVTTLQPGVYEYLQIVTGSVLMQPGVYIIRNTNPVTGIALQITAGQITANGVMFYITDSASYSPQTGMPDASTTGLTPAPLSVMQVAPSAVINAGLLGSSFAPLSGTGSPYDNILIFQNPTDRRIIVISRDTLLSSGSLSGTIYSKWGNVILVGMGTFYTRFVVGSMRFISVGDVLIQPSQLLPAAQDVFLVQ